MILAVARPKNTLKIAFCLRIVRSGAKFVDFDTTSIIGVRQSQLSNDGRNVSISRCPPLKKRRVLLIKFSLSTENKLPRPLRSLKLCPPSRQNLYDVFRRLNVNCTRDIFNLPKLSPPPCMDEGPGINPGSPGRTKRMKSRDMVKNFGRDMPVFRAFAFRNNYVCRALLLFRLFRAGTRYCVIT